MIPLLLTPLLLAALTSAQTTTTATILLPDWCVTQSAPAVTVLGQNSLTTYSYGCTINSAAVSSAEARASSALAAASSLAHEAQSKASAIRASLNLNLPNIPSPTNIPGFGSKHKRDCLGFNAGAFDACIPWEVTQGASYWAVHYTATGVIGLEQECTFGDGGVASGAATCTASGKLDPSVWVNGDAEGRHTQTFAKSDVDKYWIRDTVAVTAGGEALATGGGPGEFLDVFK